jgi:anti-sigma-K factor RskA
MPEEHVYDLLPGFALGCLDASEENQVIEHLALCERCQAELRRFDSVVEELPLAVNMIDPPAELKMRILSKARQTGEPEPEKSSSWSRFLQSIRQSAPVWGIASVALVLVLAVSNLFLWQRLGQVQGEGQLAMRTVVLTGTDFTPDATGRVIISRDGRRGVVVVDGLPQLDESQQYQLWLIKDGERDSGGVFSVGSSGYGWVYVRSPDPLAGYEAAGITIEPAGGSTGPTGEKVLGGNL